jgi:uncharacterized protein YvpB
LVATEKENMNVADLKRYIDNGIPIIMIVQAWPDETVDWENEYDWGHYVVAIGYDDENIYFEDPASIIRTWLSYDELMMRWHTYVDQERKAKGYGIAITSKEDTGLGYYRWKMEKME